MVIISAVTLISVRKGSTLYHSFLLPYFQLMLLENRTSHDIMTQSTIPSSLLMEMQDWSPFELLVVTSFTHSKKMCLLFNIYILVVGLEYSFKFEFMTAERPSWKLLTCLMMNCGGSLT